MTREHLVIAADVLGRAFADYPSLVAFIPDAARRHRLSPLLHGMLARYAAAYGDLQLSPDLDAAACWLPPERPYLSTMRLISRGGLMPIVRLGWSAFRDFSKLGDDLEATRRRLVPRPHWYLLLLAVDPARQQRGAGSLLIRRGLERADAAGLPVYLETLKEINLRFYRKHGFRVVHEGDCSVGGLRAWGLLREPQAVTRGSAE